VVTSVKITSAGLLILLPLGFVLGSTLHVPSQYPTIQAGIDAASDGDSVLVADGIYTGDGNKNIDFQGKAIAVLSENGADNTIIDCENEGRGVYFRHDEQPTSVFSGFMITGGYMVEGDGGGIFVEHAHPTITNCVIASNASECNGGGIACLFSDAVIVNCVMIGNAGTWSSGGMHLNHSDVTLGHCNFKGNIAFFAGGLGCEQSQPLIVDCNFLENSATGDGGGMFIGFYSWVEIRHCVFEGNSAERGGGIWCYKGTAIVERCIIAGNRANNGGGYYCDLDADNYIINCTLSGNLAETNGGGIFINPGNTAVINTIIAGSEGNGGVFFSGNTNADIRFSDFHDNENGPFTGMAPPALGQLITVNANGDSCDAFHNILLDPLFVALSGDSAFYLTEDSPCIDAGDPHVEGDPDGTVVDIGVYYFDQSTLLSVTLTPYHPPIIIPATGGSFEFNATIENTGASSQTFDFWVIVTLPSGSPIELTSVLEFTLPGGSMMERVRRQRVPAPAPAGTYTYSAYVGDYPDMVEATDSFTFQKLGNSSSGVASDWLFKDEIERQEDVVLCVSPNPFNPKTVISYQLSVVSFVNLAVYDVRGRKVTELVNGWRDAGVHEVVFDGSGLAAGVYVLHLDTDFGSQVTKVLLIK
jgi:hypothetical protein